MHLYEQHCDPLISPVPLTTKEIKIYLKELPLWKHTKSNELSREFKFRDYQHTLSFVNSIAKIATQENHHPVIEFGYNKCTVDFKTHSASSVTLFDVICAAHVEQIFLKEELL